MWIRNKITQLFFYKAGKGLVEITLICCLVVVVVIVILLLLGPVVGHTFSNIVSNLPSTNYSATTTASPAGVSTYQLVAGEISATCPPDCGEKRLAASGNETNAPLGQGHIPKRLIIKNAELDLLVEDTDMTINRSIGIISEYEGYIINSRIWFAHDQKYATLTIGLPVENFEPGLDRLKELAIMVTQEAMSGKDVTDQFIDLEARLRHLEATQARLYGFLVEAANVKEALAVNTELAELEAAIEQVKGQMAYLQDRTAFSRITLQISPQGLSPAESWSAARTFERATLMTRTMAYGLFQFGTDLMIWVGVVILPFSLPILGLIWLVRRLTWR